MSDWQLFHVMGRKAFGAREDDEWLLEGRTMIANNETNLRVEMRDRIRAMRS
jgi:hypothetical protein